MFVLPPSHHSLITYHNSRFPNPPAPRQFPSPRARHLLASPRCEIPFTDSHESTTGGSLPLSMSNGPAVAALLFAPRPLLHLTSGGPRGASGLYRFYLPLIADLLGRLLVRRKHADRSGHRWRIDSGGRVLRRSKQPIRIGASKARSVWLHLYRWRGLVGVVFAIASAFIGYPVSDAGERYRVLGVPFLAAAFDSASRDYVGPLTLLSFLANALVWFFLPQIVLFCWRIFTGEKPQTPNQALQPTAGRSEV